MHSMASGRCGPRGFSRETALQDRRFTAMSGPRRHRHHRGGWGGPGGPGGFGPRGPRAARDAARRRPGPARRGAAQRLPADAGDRAAQRGAGARARAQLPRAVAARGRGPGRREQGPAASLRAHRRGAAPTSRSRGTSSASPGPAVSGGFPKEMLELRNKISRETGAAAWQVLKAGDAGAAEKASQLLD